MSEWATQAIARHDALTILLRQPAKNRIAVGNCDPDKDPLAEVRNVVEMEPIQVGVKSFTPEVRIVESRDGETFFFQGGLGENILYEDVKKLIHGPQLGKLTHSLNRVAERKRSKLLINATKS